MYLFQNRRDPQQPCVGQTQILNDLSCWRHIDRKCTFNDNAIQRKEAQEGGLSPGTEKFVLSTKKPYVCSLFFPSSTLLSFAIDCCNKKV